MIRHWWFALYDDGRDDQFLATDADRREVAGRRAVAKGRRPSAIVSITRYGPEVPAQR